MYLITGATGGLGKAFAVECAARSWDLVVTDLREDSLALLAAGLARTYGVEVKYQAADLTRPESRAMLFARIADEGMRFRGLINVAGLDHEGPFMERNLEELTSILRLNIESTLMMTHALLAHRDPALAFRIINVSSLGAYFSMPIKATYAASKRFLLDFSLALRNELRDENVSVTVLCPAGLPTNEVCIEAIEAQGFMGHLTTVNIGAAAHQAIETALHGGAIVIPGFWNRALLWLSSFVPASSVADVIGDRWRAAQQRRSH
jgi:short-subunit dehydrogenase